MSEGRQVTSCLHPIKTPCEKKMENEAENKIDNEKEDEKRTNNLLFMFYPGTITQII